MISSVASSIARYDPTAGMRERPCADWRGSYCGDLSLSSFSRFHATDCAPKALPSWKVTPGRILNVHLVLSAASTHHEVARPGTISDALSAELRSQFTRPS